MFGSERVSEPWAVWLGELLEIPTTLNIQAVNHSATFNAILVFVLDNIYKVLLKNGRFIEVFYVDVSIRQTYYVNHSFRY